MAGPAAGGRWRWARRAEPVSLWLATALLVAVGAWHAVVHPLTPLVRLELAFDDLRQQALRPAAEAPYPGIAIVDIDDASLRRIGRWPWGRDQLARLVDALFDHYHVAALGLDMVFPEPELGDWPALQALARQDPALRAHLPAWRAALDHDTVLAQALDRRPVVLGYYFTGSGGALARAGQLPAPLFGPAALQGLRPRLPHWAGYNANIGVLAEAAPHAGFFNFLPDADGLVRSVPLVGALDGQVYASLDLALWQLSTSGPSPGAVPQGVPQSAPLFAPLFAPSAGQPGEADLLALRLRTATGPVAAPPAAAALPPVPVRSSEQTVVLDERGRARVPFRGPGGPRGGSFDYVSAADVLAGTAPVARLAGRTVLVGSSAPGVGDLRPTPVDPAMPGVEVHAQLLAGLLSGRLPYRPGWAPGFEAVLIALTVGLSAWAAARLSAPRALAALAGLAAALLLGNAAAFHAGLVLPLASALVLGCALALAVLGRRYVGEWQRRQSLQQLFGSYLPPQRVRDLVREMSRQNPRHQVGDPMAWAGDADNRELTVLFCDLQGFSGLAERLPPQALRALLNQFFSLVSQTVHAHDGTLDKFIGDAVMAFWGAPLPEPAHAARAVAAALALADAAGPLNDRLRASGLPPVQFGLGLATGVVCVGDLGSRLRRSYTAVGDAVNLAARLEALTRELGIGLLVADRTRDACGSALPELVWAEVDQVQVRGRSQAVTLFTPLTAPAPQTLELRGQVRLWQLALAAARRQHWSDAQALLDRLARGDAEPAGPSPGLDPAPDTALALCPALRALHARLTHQIARHVPAVPHP
jgi:adenylate cyclase